MIVNECRAPNRLENLTVCSPMEDRIGLSDPPGRSNLDSNRAPNRPVRRAAVCRIPHKHRAHHLIIRASAAASQTRQRRQSRSAHSQLLVPRSTRSSSAGCSIWRPFDWPPERRRRAGQDTGWLLFATRIEPERHTVHKRSLRDLSKKTTTTSKHLCCIEWLFNTFANSNDACRGVCIKLSLFSRSRWRHR